MTDHSKPEKDWWINTSLVAFLTISAAMFPLGVYLALHFDSGNWLVLAAWPLALASLVSVVAGG